MPQLVKGNQSYTSSYNSISKSPVTNELESDSDSDISWIMSVSKEKIRNDITSRTQKDGRYKAEELLKTKERGDPSPLTLRDQHLSADMLTPSSSAPGRSALPVTPSRSSRKADSSSTKSAVAVATSLFDKMSIQPTSSPIAKTKRYQILKIPDPNEVIEVDSTDEEADALTDNDSNPPTRGPSFYNRSKAIPRDSSESSLDVFLSPSVSATSSFSSVASSQSVSSTVKILGSSSSRNAPIHANNVLSSPARLNITPRRSYGTPSQPFTSIKRTIQTFPTPPLKQPSSAPVQLAFSSEERRKTVLDFAKSDFCVDLPKYVIAHNDVVQRLFDRYGIAWGTQWELAKGVTNGSWSWEDIRQKIDKIKVQDKNGEWDITDSNKAAKVRSIMQGRDTEGPQPAERSIWEELDREQAAIMEDLHRGLGLMGEWHNSANWYGGKIQQIVRLLKDEKTGQYKFVLEPMEKRKSHRFARYYGSRRFLHLRISEEMLKQESEKIKRFLFKKFILCGRVFVPFHSKDHALYMVETDENHGRSPQEWCGDEFRLSFQEFVNWHNPLDVEKNYKQVISKYAARFALGLSNSVPVLEFEEDNIIFIEDITASDWPKGKSNPPADKLMTDGCGFMNHAALQHIVKALSYESLPAGVQGRIDGSKGFWILHPTDDSSVPKIWIRDSQNKIKNRSFDRAHKIFDLLAPSRPSAPIAITAQSIINSFFNCVPGELLIKFMEEGLEDEIAPLLDWNKPNSMVFLWDAINKSGNVSGSRSQRFAVSLNRALGLKGRDWGRDDEDEDEDSSQGNGSDEDDSQKIAYLGRNPYSKLPVALHETAVEMIQAGFHPSSNFLLHEKMRYIVKNTIKSSVEKYRIPILESFNAFIVPDPLGILQEGEIYYRFSRARKDPKTDMLVHVLEGDVLLGRYPIRLPSDMQKVKAVNRPELDKWPDLILVSIKGTRSIASLLAGGDMDGDDPFGIFCRVMVDLFQNQPFVEPPEDLISKNFESTSKVETVERFCIRAKELSPSEISIAFLEHMIANISQSQVGFYSMFHENCTIKYGYDHSESVRLAYIFATLLDASKTGHRLRDEVFQKDKAQYSNQIKMTIPNEILLSRDILGQLKFAASQKGEELLSRLEKNDLIFFQQSRRDRYKNNQFKTQDELRKEFKEDKDPELSRPYNNATDFAMNVYTQTKINVFTEELSKIRRHVDSAKSLYDNACSTSSQKKETQETPLRAGNTPRKTKKSSKSNDLMLAATRAYTQLVPGVSLTQNVEQIKASYAYILNPNFGYSVAFGELCHIKASTSGNLAPNLRIFDEGKAFSASFLRMLKRCDEEAASYSNLA